MKFLEAQTASHRSSSRKLPRPLLTFCRAWRTIFFGTARTETRSNTALYSAENVPGKKALRSMTLLRMPQEIAACSVKLSDAILMKFRQDIGSLRSINLRVSDRRARTHFPFKVRPLCLLLVSGKQVLKDSSGFQLPIGSSRPATVYGMFDT